MRRTETKSTEYVRHRAERSIEIFVTLEALKVQREHAAVVRCCSDSIIRVRHRKDVRILLRILIRG